MITRTQIKEYYPAIIIIAWYISISFTFVIMTDWLSLFYILLFPMLISFEILHRLYKKKLSLRIDIFELPIVVYIMWMALSLLTNDSLPLPRYIYGAEFLFRIVSPVMIYWFIRLYPLNSQHLKLMAYAFIGLLLIETALGYISLVYPTLLPTPFQPRIIHFYTRATGSFGSPESYVMTLFLCIIFIFYESLMTDSSQRKWFLRGIVAVGVIGVLLSQNRTGWFNLVLIMVVICYIDRSIIRWVLAGLLTISLATLILYPNFISKSLNRLQEFREVESRIILNGAGLRMFIEEPIIGWGYATYDLYDWKYTKPIGDMQPGRFELAIATSHNTYLTILAETGIVGFVLYMLVTVYWFGKTVYTWRRDRPDKDRIVIMLMWTLIAVVHIAAQLADMRFFPFILASWWLALAMIANLLSTSSTATLPSISE